MKFSHIKIFALIIIMHFILQSFDSIESDKEMPLR